MGLFDSLDSELTGSDIFAHLDDPWSHEDEGGLPSTLSTGGLEYAPVDDDMVEVWDRSLDDPVPFGGYDDSGFKGGVFS